MNALNKMKIGVRMTTSFMIVSALIVIVAVVGFINMKNINDGMQTMFEDRLKPIAQLGHAEKELYSIRGNLYKFVLLPDERAKIEQEIQASIVAVNEQLAAYRATQMLANEQEELARFDAAWAAYQNETKNTIAKSKAGNDSEAIATIVDGGATANARQAVGASIEKLMEINETEADELNDGGDRTFNLATIVMVVLGIIAVILSVVLGVIITRSIVRPLNEVVNQLRILANAGGDLTVRLPAEAQDEIGELARVFNAFVESLGNIIRNIAAGAAKLASSTTQISASANEMAAGADSQNQQAIRTSSSMEEITAAFQEVSRNTASTSNAARAAVQRAQQGSARVQSTLTELNESNVAFQQLRQRSAEISQLVSLIAEIASQTNILALNAAIEAAGAGAVGSRFDVVAEEIRKLAQRTTDSTARITATVDQIQTDIQSAAARMERSVVQVQETEQSLTDIVEGIASVNDMVSVISTATNQQVQAASQVAEALQLITQVTEQTAKASSETARTTDDLASLAQTMRETSEKFRV